MGLNKVMLIGRAARAPEIRWLDAHNSHVEFPFVIDRSYRTADGAERTARTEIAIVASGPVAERCKALSTSSRDVLIEGRLKYESWKEESGTPRSRYCVVAERCEFDGAPPGPQAAERRREAAREPRELVAAGA